MGIKEQDKLNAPAAESTPPARETGVVSHRDGIDMAPRHFVTSNHGIVISPDIVKTYNDSAFFSMQCPMQICELSKFADCRFTLVFQGAERFFSPFL